MTTPVDNTAQSSAQARAKARTDALANPASANFVLAAAYDDHEWTPAVLDTNTTEGIRNTLRAHASAIQALADRIDGVHSAQPVSNETYGEANKPGYGEANPSRNRRPA